MENWMQYRTRQADQSRLIREQSMERVSSSQEMDSAQDQGSDSLVDSRRVKGGCVINEDSFGSLPEVAKAIKDQGLETCGLIFGIDYTMSNRIQGKYTFDGKSLHHISDASVNPYQEVICILGETLESFNEGSIPVYGFGDARVKDKGIFSLKEDCDGFYDVLEVYNTETPNIKMSGPTNFAPMIEEAIEVVKRKRQYQILTIVADGQVTKQQDTIDAIVKASTYPLSIILIGVGDGPWDVMKVFDEKLPERAFDNFNFVEFHAVKARSRNPLSSVALAALMEIPGQYKTIRDQGLLHKLSE